MIDIRNFRLGPSSSAFAAIEAAHVGMLVLAALGA